MEEQTGVYLVGTKHLSREQRYLERRASQICGQVSQEVGFELDSLGRVNKENENVAATLCTSFEPMVPYGWPLYWHMQVLREMLLAAMAQTAAEWWL